MRNPDFDSVLTGIGCKHQSSIALRWQYDYSFSRRSLYIDGLFGVNWHRKDMMQAGFGIRTDFDSPPD